ADSRAVWVPVEGPKPPPERLTLTPAVLAAAREAWVLVSGSGKETALRESLQPGGRTPLADLLRRRERTVIFSDVAP
ncbi:MAG: 6-phosphogluconolactonase, partial [Verrucomicrobia bacterium]